MKKIFFFCSLFTAAFTYAQDCSNYYFLQNNKTVEMTIYNKKGEMGAKQVYTVSDVKNSGSTTTATVNSEMFDKKGKSIAKSTGVYKCDGGVLMVDLKMSLAPQQSQQFKDAEVKAEDFYIEYPATMNPGDQLKDGNMNLEIDNNGMKQSVSMAVTNRKVEGKEPVTTPAGTWECYKISYKSKMTIKTMGVGIPVNMEGIEWYAPGFGVVKTDSKQGGTAITSIK